MSRSAKFSTTNGMSSSGMIPAAAVLFAAGMVVPAATSALACEPRPRAVSATAAIQRFRRIDVPPKSAAPRPEPPPAPEALATRCSADAGKTWSQPDTPTAETLYAISFADAQNGWAVGASGTIVRSTDGGATWAKQPVQLPDDMGGTRPLDVNLFGVAATGATEAWAVGDLGAVLHTKD